MEINATLRPRPWIVLAALCRTCSDSHRERFIADYVAPSEAKTVAEVSALGEWVPTSRRQKCTCGATPPVVRSRDAQGAIFRALAKRGTTANHIAAQVIRV